MAVYIVNVVDQGYLRSNVHIVFALMEPSSAPYLVNGKLCRNHMYFYQVQTQLYVCSANYSDFVVATFCSEIANISTERILPDDEFMKQCIEKSITDNPWIAQIHTLRITSILKGLLHAVLISPA